MGLIPGDPIPVKLEGAAGFYIAAVVCNKLDYQSVAMLMIFIGTIFLCAEFHKRGLPIWPPTRKSLILVMVALFVFIALSLILAPDPLSDAWGSFADWVLSGLRGIGNGVADWFIKWWWVPLLLLLIILLFFLHKYVIMAVAVPLLWIKELFKKMLKRKE